MNVCVVESYLIAKSITKYCLKHVLIRLLNSYDYTLSIVNYTPLLLLLLFGLHVLFKNSIVTIIDYRHKKLSGNGVPTREILRDSFLLLLLD